MKPAILFSGSVVAFLLLSVVCIGRSVRAEPREASVLYYDVELPVDEKVSAGGELLKVAIGGEAFLVSEKEAPRKVVLRYLSNKNALKQKPIGFIKAVAQTAAGHSDWEVFQAAIVRAATGAEESVLFESQEEWQDIIVDNLAAGIALDTLRKFAEQIPIGRACAMSAVAQRIVKREPATSQMFYRIADECLRRQVVETVKAIFGGEAISSVLEELRYKTTPFVDEARNPSTEIVELEQVVSTLGDSIANSRTLQLESSLTKLLEISDRFRVAANSTVIRNAFIAQAVAGRAFKAAIEQIAKVPFESRTSRMHSVLIQALRESSVHDRDVLLDPVVRSVLIRYVEKDEEVYSQWIATHREMILRLASEGSLESSSNVVKQICREDPVIGKTVGLSTIDVIVAGYLDRGNVVAVKQIIRDVGIPLSLYNRVRMFVVSNQGFAAGIFAGLGGLVLALLYRVGRARRRDFGQRGAREEAGGIGQDDTQSKVKGLAEQRVDGEAQSERFVSADSQYSLEYVAALRSFGLEPGATLAEIKNTYRGVVKQYHPDRNGADTQDSTSHFIRVTLEYEKLLELHEREQTRQSAEKA